MIKTNPNILLFASEFPPLPGGIGNHAYNLAKYLQLGGLSVTVLVDQRTESKIEHNFDNQSPFKTIRVKRNRVRAWMYLKRIWLFLRLASKHDKIIVSGKFPLWIGALHRYLFKKTVIAIIHGSEVNFTNNLLKKTINISLRKYDHIIAVSNYTKSLVEHLDISNISTITNGFDSSLWNLNTNNSFKKRKGSPSLLTVGNVTDRKGQLNVIRHLPKLTEFFPEVHYHCVGLPTKKDDFFNEAKLLGVEDYVTFHGKVSNEILQKFYQTVDIFVMLSSETNTGDVEGFGIAIIEANYLGLPAIGALGCGIEDAINNNKSGILVNAHNEKEFIAAVKSIMNNYATFSEKANQWAIEHNWSVKIEQYLKVINP